MYLDALTIAGLLSAASFLLMPLLMGRELIRVDATDETEQSPTGRETATQQPQRTPSSAVLSPHWHTHGALKTQSKGNGGVSHAGPTAGTITFR
ncbi:MAG: hypothetical protein GVY22_16720 [Gammaproteobacteria bacterium]|jgi:hypothetical protein|nr:hypothetical protein [Gammaproteobacteria bacterium]